MNGMSYKFRVCFYDEDDNFIDDVIIESNLVEDALELAVKSEKYAKFEARINYLSIIDPQEEIPFSPPLLELQITEIASYLHQNKNEASR